MKIAISGRTASGKTSFARQLKQLLAAFDVDVDIIHMDHFYRALSAEEHARAQRNEYDWDCLAAYDTEAFAREIANCRQPVCLVEGLYLFCMTELVAEFDLRIWIEVDDDVSLMRRVQRDLVHRRHTDEHGVPWPERRELQFIIDRYERYVKPAYELEVAPLVHRADIVVPRGVDNHAALDTLLAIIRRNVSQQILSLTHFQG